MTTATAIATATYIMEHPREGLRLERKIDADAWVKKHLAPYLFPGARVLDAGCGPGTILRAMAEWERTAFGSGVELGLARVRILMDIGLPEMDRWQVTRLLKSDPETRGIPIIALTAHALQTDREKASEVGCDDYDTKPVEFARLMQKIDGLLYATKATR